MKYSIAIALALSAPLAAMSQVVFSDNFSGASTVQSATPGAGTASSADYEVFTTVGAPAGETIAANNLSFSSISSGSTTAEVEARFGSSATTLSTIGDSINLQVTFTDVGNVMIAGQNSNASLNIGLFNSGGINLNQGVRLDAAPQITGGSQTYQGYVSRLFMNGNASSFNRATQTIGASTTSQNQDLLFNNASSTGSFSSPLGTTTTATFGSPTPLGNNVGLTAGNQYTISYTILLTAANAVKIEDKLFTGVGTGGTLLQDNGGTSTSGAFLGSSFDALGFGWRYTSATAASGTLDVNNINVTFIPAPAPEPTTLALSAFGGLGLLVVRRWKNRK